MPKKSWANVPLWTPERTHEAMGFEKVSGKKKDNLLKENDKKIGTHVSTNPSEKAIKSDYTQLSTISTEEYKKHLERIKNDYENNGMKGSVTQFILFCGGFQEVLKIFKGLEGFLRVLEDVGYSKGYRCDLKRKWKKKY